MITYTKHLITLMGTPAEHRESIIVACSMALVVLCYQMLSDFIVTDFVPNWFEIIGTWSGLICVWLARTQNILTWPWGIVSAATLGYFFATIGLPGQQWLNWGYFLIIQLWAWPQWVYGGAKRTPLMVTRLSIYARVAVVLVVAACTLVVYRLIDVLVPGSVYPLLDALVVASSIVAQYLLGLKKVESWVLWLGPVNLLSIVLFMSAGAYTVMALYIAFFIHAVCALRAWRTAAL